jgi:hypothetical protein
VVGGVVGVGGIVGIVGIVGVAAVGVRVAAIVDVIGIPAVGILGIETLDCRIDAAPIVRGVTPDRDHVAGPGARRADGVRVLETRGERGSRCGPR